MLGNIRVLDFTHVLSGPYATMLLGDMGAEVWKVEKPGRGDTTRGTPPFINGVSHYFLAVNRNKKSVAIDLKQAEGIELIKALVRSVDVVVNNFRPGVMEQLGIGFEALSAYNPTLIYCTISGFGETGPLREKTSFDLITQAMSGFMSVTGEPGGPPLRTGVSIGDVVSGAFAVSAIATALYRREREGVGARLDIGMMDSLVSLLTYYIPLTQARGTSPGPEGSMHATVVPMGAFAASDGYITIAAFNQRFWKNLCRAVDHEEWVEDPRFATLSARQKHRDELIALIGTVIREKTMAHWAQLFDKYDVPSGPVLTMDQVMNLDQVQVRQNIRQMEHPDAGPIALANNPYHLDSPDGGPWTPAPRLGQDTDAVLAGVLGLTVQEIEALRQRGVLG